MHTVRDLLIRKPAKIVMIDPRCTALQALVKMGEHGIGALLVADKEGNLAGIVTERDIAKGAAKFGETLLKRPVGALMTSDLITCDVTDSIVDALVMMSGARIRHLPVTDRGEVVGFLSVRDMLEVCVEAMRSNNNTFQQQLHNATMADERGGMETWLSA
jgi:signal-transduction protein with cAMP-binding, CBS, and nucleotidyltransferase domain